MDAKVKVVSFKSSTICGIAGTVAISFKREFARDPLTPEEIYSSNIVIQDALFELSGGLESTLQISAGMDKTSGAIFNPQKLADPVAFYSCMTCPLDDVLLHSADKDIWSGSGLNKSRAGGERVAMKVRHKPPSTLGVVRLSLLYNEYKSVNKNPDMQSVLLEDLTSISLLLLDDVGCEYSNGFINFFCEVIMRRAGSGDETVITSQYSPQSLLRKLLSDKDIDPGAAGRLCRRLSELFVNIEFRRRKPAEIQSAMKLIEATKEGGYSITLPQSTYRVRPCAGDWPHEWEFVTLTAPNPNDQPTQRPTTP